MKTTILFVGFVCCFVGQANAQTEFAPVNAEWYYTYTIGCCPENHFNRIISEKDTVVEGDNCRVLRQYYDHSTVASEKYIIKQEQGKIYYYDQDRFNLIFDFDAEVNEIVEFSFMYKQYDDDFPFGKNTVFSARYHVEDITLNAQNRKTVTTKVLEEEILDFQGILVPPSEYHTYSYTEKIGLHREFMPMFDNLPHPAEEVFRWLRCYADADFTFTTDEWSAMSLPCNYTISTDINIPEDDKNGMVYPNPFNNIISVFTNNGGDIDIMDISGKIVYSSKLSSGITEISTNHFLNGFYFINIQNKDSHSQTFKMVKL